MKYKIGEEVEAKHHHLCIINNNWVLPGVKYTIIGKYNEEFNLIGGPGQYYSLTPEEMTKVFSDSTIDAFDNAMVIL